MRKIRRWKESGERKRGRMKRMANVLRHTSRASYRAAQTNKLELTLELERAKARGDESGDRRGRVRWKNGVNERNGEFKTKFRHCEMTRVVFIAATPAERDASALSASSFFLRVLTKVSVGLSASRSFVAPFSDITAPSRPLARGRMRVIATKSLRGIEEVPQLRTHKT